MANTSSTSTSTQRAGTKTGWEKSCDCGFNLRDYNKGEFVGMVNQHIKSQHNMAPMSEGEIIKGARTITM